nr:serine-rich adhesin for platelets-like [Lytechinus pictus]
MVVIVGVELGATVSLSNRAFIPAYNNDLSPQYQELSLNFTNTMDAVFYNSDLREIYNGSTVNGFSPGSVIVNFTINLIQAPTAPTRDPSLTGSTAQPPGDGGIDDQISAIRGQVEVSIKEVIQLAENNGELTTLGVDSTTLAVTEVSVDVETQTVSEAPTTTVTPSTPSPDQEPPVIECPDDVTAETDPGAAYGFVSWTNPTATDNSGDVTVEVDFVPGQLPIGSRNITATAMDSSGNSAQCVFVATVVDVEAPVAICPDNITRSTDLGQAYATVSWSSPRGTDNSGTISGITTDLDEGQFEIGSHEITVTVVDPAGLEGQCTFDIVVQDNEAPAVECPATIEIGTDAGSPSSIVTWKVSAEDNSGSVPSISSSPSSGDVFTIGTHTVTVTALDESGNMGQCSFSIVVLDTELPVINCPANIIQPTDPGSSSASVTWQVTSTDNSGETPTTTLSAGPGLFSVGSVVIIAMATDSSGNTASCNFTVQIIDEEAPTISCPDNITVTTDMGASSAIVTWVGPFASDNSGQTTVQTDGSPGLLPIGIKMVTSTAVDGAGNEAHCSFWVNVQDLENPIVSCPSDITAELAANPVLWDATATDNSEEIANLSSSPLPADLILGENIVTVIAVDPSGNKAECTFTVTLTDTTAPSITCPADVSATVATDESSVTLTWDEPSATDLSGDVTVTVSHSPGVYTIGQITVTANATDSSGSQANCVFLLTIQDLQHPMISNCPASISVNTDSGLATAVVIWTPPSASDNSGSVSLTSNHYPGDTFPIGSTRVTYTATDSSGNFVMTCTFDIAVNDNERPVISGCPSSISVNTDSGVASWAANWTEPTATDNSGIQTLISDYYPGYPMPIGSTTVTYTSTDVTGYSATCMFVVTVIDNERPIISGCPSSITLNADNDKSTATVMWTEPTASDNSGFQTLTSDYSSGSSFPGGTTNVTYISTDDAGNTQICSFDVTVIGNASVTVSGSLAIAGTFTAELTDSSSELFQSTAANLVSGFDVIFEPLGSQYLGSTVNGFSNGSILANFTVNLGSLIESNDTDPVKSTAGLISNSINKGIEGGSFGDLPVVSGSSSIPADTEPPIIRNCPNPLPYSTDLGQYSGTAIWTVPMATDNFGIIDSIVSNYKPGDSFPVGSTLVTYTFTDASRNNASCIFNVTVKDTEAPVVSNCPSSLTFQADNGQSMGTAIWLLPTASDNSGLNVTMTSDYDSEDSFPIGSTTVTISFEDSSGNTAYCSFNITVIGNASFTVDGSLTIAGMFSSDLNDPTTVLYQNTAGGLVKGFNAIFEPLGSQYLGVIVTGFMNGSIDAGFSVILDSLIEHNGSNPLVTTRESIKNSINNGIGNGAFDDLPVVPGSLSVYQDEENPVISECPSDQDVNTDSGNATALVTWTPPTATDNSGTQTLTSTANPGDYFPIGNTTVKYTSTDASGNTDVCTFYVTVIDSENPVISGCPSNQDVNTDNGNATASVTWTPLSATDNSGNQTLTSTANTGDYFPIGNISVTYTSTDAAGNTDTCTFYISVTDNENPVISGCPSDQNVTTDIGNATAVVNWTPPTATDNSADQTLISTANPGDYFPIGNNTVNYTSTDAAENTDTCTFYISVTDNENPVISGCPSDQNVTTDIGNATTVVTWTPPTATDNSGNQTLTSTANPGDYFPIGNNTVTYTSTDASGNTDVCTFYVVVIDNENPVISGCPSDQNVTTDIGNATAVVTWTPPTATDNSGTQTLTSTANPGDYFPIGNNTVTYTSTDAYENVELCSFNLVVIDRENAMISGCPSTQYVNTDIGNATAVVTWTTPTATDNSGNQTLTSTANPGDYFPIGNNSVTYFATDVAGNSEMCTFSIVVSDNENPVISGCPSEQNVTTDSGNATAVVTWTPPTATDNSGNQTLTSTANPGDYFPIGNNTVNYTSKDPSGNTDVCTFFVIVIDNENPVISGCPSDQNVTTDIGNATAVVTWTPPTATDNSGNQTLTSTANPGDYFPIGNNTVTYTSTDASGNTDVCTFYVVVIDNENPVISGCPSDQNVTTDIGNATAVVTWAPPIATDNSGNQTLTSTANPGDYFPIGNNTVTYTSTDAYENVELCSFNVVVIDRENAMISGCPSTQDVNTDIGNATAVVTWTTPTATDNSGNQTLTSTANPGDYFPIGNNSVTYFATDVAGNSETCTFIIVVSDNENPVISGCPSEQNVTTESDNATAVVTWTPPTATDNSGNQTLTSTANPGDYFPIGNNTVNYTSTDPSGNTDVCTFYVIVIDNENPVISGCPSEQNVTTDIGNATAVVIWTPPTATDNSGNQTLTSTANPGDYFPIGNNTVTYTSTDASGNTDVCTFYVVVIDNENPVISGCPSEQNVTTESDNATAVVTWTPPTATDNSGNQTLTSTANPGDYFPIGNNTVNYTSKDPSGNTDVCTFYVIVIDNENPVISGCPSDQNVTTDIGNATAVVTWTPPTATDNSGNQTLTSTANPGDYFPIGNNTVTYTSTDASGNTDVCTFYVIVIDNENPVISGCPSDQNVTTDIGNATAVVIWILPTATDNSGNQTLTSTANPGDYFPIGNNTVTYTSTDAYENVELCSFNVVVIDRENAMISGCPSTQDVNTDIGNATAVVTWTTPTATDNSGNQTLTSTANPGDYFPIGNNSVTYFATDVAGNSETCTFIIVVSDNENPVISGCPSEQNVTTESDNATAVVTWTPPTATDNSGNQTLTSTANPGDYFPIGNNTVNYTSTDPSGNTDVCTFYVIVIDNENPVISGCPSDQNVTTDIGNATAVVTWTPPTATDNSGNQTLTSTANPGDYFLIGNNTVTYTSTDSAVNIVTCTFDVVVSDNENPVISGCPSDQNVTTDIGNATAVVIWTPPTATDNSGNQTLTSTANPGDNLPIGNSTVTYTSTDSYGNVEICSFHVVVIDSCDLNHFSCGLPVCLPNEWLCDGVPDCPDKSDENNCSSLPAVVNSPTCGLTPVITSRIVGGTDARYGQWPWIASLSIRVRDLPFYHFCGATLISDQWAMTAAHCVHPPVFELIADKLLLGDIDLYGSAATRQLIDIEGVYVHPAFNEFVIDYDVALIKLSAPVQLGDYISPVCLETSSEESSLYSQCISIGWGSTVSGGSLSPSLQEATFNLTEIEECRNITGDDELTENHICAWDPRGGVSVCQGDSGSSLMCQEYSGTWRLVGITSSNYGCADANNPGVNNLPDIYTRVSKHWDWVNSVIEGTPLYRCEDIIFPSCTAVLPYNRTYSTSQTPSYKFIIDNLNEIENKTCHRNLEALICGSTFKECHVDGPGRVPCRQMCEEVKMACSAELQVFGLYLDRLLPCDLFPAGPSNDTLLCEYGVDYSCGNTNLIVSRTVPATITNPSFPSYGNDRHICTWFVSVSDPTNVLLIKFLTVNIDFIIGTLLVGEGSDSANLTSVIYEVRTSSTPIETGLGSIWLSYASTFSSKGFELQLWAVQSGSTDFCSDSSSVACSLGFSCVPEEWVCDGIADCESFEDELNCTVPLNCPDGYMRCQSNENCIPSSWLCDDFYDCLDDSDEADCPTIQSCPSDGVQTIPASMPFSIMSDNYPMNYPINFECLWLLQADANHSLVIDILDFTLESGYDYLYIGLGHNQSNENSVVLELTGSITPTRYYLGMKLYLQFLSDSSVSRSGFSLNVTSIPFDLTESCDADQRVLEGSYCDGVMDCFDKSDEFECGTSCPSNNSIQTIPSSMPYSIISDNYPFNYNNNFECFWLLQAAANHSLVIDVLVFTLESGYDYLYIGLGHNQSTNNSVVLELTGSIAPTRYYLGMRSYLQFVSDSSISRSGFLLKVASITLELTESCDADQRVLEGSKCDGVIDCFDNSDEFGCEIVISTFQCEDQDIND